MRLLSIRICISGRLRSCRLLSFSPSQSTGMHVTQGKRRYHTSELESKRIISACGPSKPASPRSTWASHRPSSCRGTSYIPAGCRNGGNVTIILLTCGGLSRIRFRKKNNPSSSQPIVFVLPSLPVRAQGISNLCPSDR